MTFWDWFIRPIAEFAGSLFMISVVALFVFIVLAATGIMNGRLKK